MKCETCGCCSNKVHKTITFQRFMCYQCCNEYGCIIFGWYDFSEEVDLSEFLPKKKAKKCKQLFTYSLALQPFRSYAITYLLFMRSKRSTPFQSALKVEQTKTLLLIRGDKMQIDPHLVESWKRDAHFRAIGAYILGIITGAVLIAVTCAVIYSSQS